MSKIIGLDFDNTLICHAPSFHTTALAHGWIDEDVQADKKAIREYVRRQPDGEKKWQQLQAQVYGPKIHHAVPFDGVHQFLSDSLERGVVLCIVSHKTAYAAQDTAQRHNLIDAARNWLFDNAIVSDTGPVLTENVFFEPTREKKVARIAAMGCDVFIDDLEETFAEPDFPQQTMSVLFGNGAPSPRIPSVTVCRTWKDIGLALWQKP